jgi:hypothetical protein
MIAEVISRIEPARPWVDAMHRIHRVFATTPQPR